VMMPGENGFDYARSVRETSRVPILMLTARSNPNDRVMGLEIGADDYLPKPFEPRELILRLNNIIKRSARPRAAARAPGKPPHRATRAVLRRPVAHPPGAAAAAGSNRLVIPDTRHSVTRPALLDTRPWRNT